MAKKHLSEDEIKLIISGDSSKLQEELHKLTKETKDLRREERERRKAMVELEAQGKKNSKEYQNLAKECKTYTDRISKNNEKINVLTRNLNVNNLSMRQLKKEAKSLSEVLEDMTESANPEEYAKLNTRLAEVRRRMSELRNAGKNMNDEFGNSVSWMSKLTLAVKAFIAVKVVGWLKSAHDQAYETRKEFAKYEAVLRNTFQSQKKANEAMKMLQQLAADTPSSLQEWTEAYIKLINRGIKPTRQELINMGDLAASQGKSIDQLIEAVLDAMTGENERLKEFGIKASKNGEITKFTFRGITTEVRNTEDSIKDYLLSLGKIEGITGSMAVQMEELEGIQSNLGDSMDAFFNKVGKKLEPFWKSMLKWANNFFTTMGELFTSYTETYENHFDKMVQLESAIPGLLSRYEELTSKSSRSAEEQQELASIITQIRNLVPGAVAAFDEYGRAIEISSEKVDEFVRKQRALLKFENAKAIKETQKQIDEYRTTLEKLQNQYEHGVTRMVTQGMFASPIITVDTSDETKNILETEINKYSDLLLGAEEKLKQLNGQTLEETIQAQQQMAEKRKEFNNMTKTQLDSWIKDEKNAASQYLSIAQEIYNKRFPVEDPEVAKKKAAAAAKAAKEALTAAEKEQKAKISTEQAAVKSLENLREDDLQAQQKWYNDSLAALNTAQANKKITKEQYEMMLLGLEKQNADARLLIEKSYYSDAESMAITDAQTKEDIIRKSNQRVIDAENTANKSRIAQQEALNNLVKNFKEQFKLTTVDEDYEMQLQVLEASYQARKEMAEKNNLDATELDKAYFRAKEQLEAEHQQKILAIRNQYGLSTQQERFNAELEQLRLAREQQLLTEEEYEQSVQNLKRDSYKKQFDYYSNLFSGAVQALQQAEMDQIDAKYDAEIEAAKGDAEEVERLENEKAQKKLEVQKKYADVNFAIKASQIIADTAVSIMKAYADLGPIAGSVAAVLMGVTGIAQLASAKAERDKVKNMTLSGSSSSSGGTGARVATGRQSGGKIDVRRAQDGKLFPNSDYDPDARGFIDHPTVIVGEGPAGQSKEWVASNAAVSNPTVAPILDILDKSQQAGTIRTLDLNQVIRTRMAGYSSGGSIGNPIPVSSIPTNDSGAILPPELMKRFANAIVRLDEEGLPPAPVLLSEIEKKQELRNRSRAIGSKK
jgi:hypothetical protein